MKELHEQPQSHTPTCHSLPWLCCPVPWLFPTRKTNKNKEKRNLNIYKKKTKEKKIVSNAKSKKKKNEKQIRTAWRAAMFVIFVALSAVHVSLRSVFSVFAKLIPVFRSFSNCSSKGFNWLLTKSSEGAAAAALDNLLKVAVSMRLGSTVLSLPPVPMCVFNLKTTSSTC